MKKLMLLFGSLPFFMFGQIQIGDDVDGETAGDQSGYSVSLSSDGNTAAIGAIYNDGNGASSGQVRIYENINGTWSQIGNDIDGEASVDLSGYSVSLSSDGSIVAIGAYRNDGNGTDSGQVRVYENSAGAWTLIGSDINGEASRDWFGWSTSLSANGNIVAIGGYGNDTNGNAAGYVQVYENINGTWTQIGNDIDGEAADNYSGWSVSLSSDGSIVAIGAPGNSGVNGLRSGHVRVFKNSNGSWTQIGSDIDWEAASDQFGCSVSLSSDGSIVAIGAISNNGNGSGSGHVRIYKNVSNTWTQIGSDIDGEAAGDYSGQSVSISSDGGLVAIGANLNDGNGTDSGHVRIYKNISNTWTQIGSDIDGEAASDQFGYSVSLSSIGNILAIGAPFNDGNQLYSDIGHVRVYDLSALLSADSFKVELSKLYPNPASVEIHVTLKKGLHLLKVNLYNQLGQFIKQSNGNKIDVSELSKGLYLVEIVTNKGKGTKKILLQ